MIFGYHIALAPTILSILLMNAENTKVQANWQLKIEYVLAKPFLQHGIVALIFINAVLLGMETSPWIMGV